MTAGKRVERRRLKRFFGSSAIILKLTHRVHGVAWKGLSLEVEGTDHHDVTDDGTCGLAVFVAEPVCQTKILEAKLYQPCYKQLCYRAAPMRCLLVYFNSLLAQDNSTSTIRVTP